MTGRTCVGETWLTCALAYQACCQGDSVLLRPVARLPDELGIGRAGGRYMKLLKQLTKIVVLSCQAVNASPKSAPK
ncbi:ATP-binding protein [Massilia sp. DWR3-1-1]|uniref:ATP-binding protein n=1 Tax=Massilia sp. DWR3-1-1 TaxID=2804559 RepID=UPI003CEB9D6C